MLASSVRVRPPPASELERYLSIISPVPSANFKRACLAALVLAPMGAYGSFGGTPCRADFGCHFLTWGGLIGVAGVPISAAIFAVLHLIFCNSARSKLRQFFLGGFIGMGAYEISAACAALVEVWSWGKATPGQYLVIALISTFLMLAIVSVLYARSSPGHRLRREVGLTGDT